MALFQSSDKMDRDVTKIIATKVVGNDWKIKSPGQHTYKHEINKK